MNPILYKLTKAKYQKMFPENVGMDESIRQHDGSSIVALGADVDVESWDYFKREAEAEIRGSK